MRLLIAGSSLVAASFIPAALHAQTNAPDGAAVFARACATCHKPGQSEVPAPEVLRTLTPESIGSWRIEYSNSTPSVGGREPCPHINIRAGRCSVVDKATAELVATTSVVELAYSNSV